MLTFATLLGALLATSSPGEPTFSRAYLRPDGLCFDSPVELDWEALARREFKDFPLDSPPPDELLSHVLHDFRGKSFFTFSAPLPDVLARLHFHVLTESGSHPIDPRELVGTIRYTYASPDRPQPPTFSGEVCLPAPPGLADAGFVVAVAAPVSWQTAPAELERSGSRTLVRLESGASPVPPPGLDAGATDVKTAYVLSSPELPARYLVVRRVAECPKVCCEFTYDTYRWEPDLPVVASNTYGCDI